MHFNCLNLRLAGYNTRPICSLGVSSREEPRRQLELPRVISDAAACAQVEKMSEFWAAAVLAAAVVSDE